jgi:starch-binding outer membrane protein, SusD/RagB family
MRQIFRFGGRLTHAMTCAAAAAMLAACSSVTDSLLEVEDPDLINPANTNSAAGAVAVANGALGRLKDVTIGQESTWLFGGLLADEWGTSSTFIQNDEADWRKIQSNNSSVGNQLRRLFRVRTASNQAIALLKQYDPTRTALRAEMYFARGFAELQLASDFCNGIPLSDGATETIVFGDPMPVAAVFATAIASFDSALATATGTDAASVRVQRAARVGKARAQLGINQFAAAAATIGGTAGVPTNFSYTSNSSLATNDNTIWSQGLSQRRYSVADSLEGNSRNLLVRNAIPFFSARDPRLPVTDTRVVGQDGGTFVRTTTLYGRLTPIDVVNGLDARLVEAEAALRNNNPTQWLAIMNALRQGPDRITQIGDVVIGATALPLLTDPGTPEARISLHFREKAFWTFSRGQRLGDLRRLVRQFGRPANQVFPVGPHYKTSVYGDDVNLPIHTDEANNPKFSACLDRNA